MGVGREANNLTPEKNSIVQEPNRGKNWSDILERHGRGKGLKNEIWMATWNVLSLNRAGSLRKLKEDLTKYRIGIAAIQEIQWPGTEIMETGNFTNLYSGSTKSALDTGFVVSKEYKGSIMEFRPINEKICTLRIRARLFNITLICVHASTEETEEEVVTDFMKSWKMCMMEQWAMM